MTTRPTDTPRWATTPTYPNVDPGDTKRAAGYVPSEKPPAQEYNYIANLVGEWIDYLRELNVSNWFERASDAASSADRWNAIAAAEDTGVCVAGGFDVGGNLPRYNYSDYGQRWLNAVSTLTAGAEILFVHRDTRLGLFIGGGGDDDVETSPNGQTWTNRTIGGPNPIVDMDDNGQPNPDHEIIGVGGLREYVRSTNGTTWTYGGFPSGTNVTYGCAHNKLPGASGLWVAVGENGDIHTTPGGATPTWTKRTDPTGGADLYGVVYDAHSGWWVAVGDGVVIRSQDGVTWVLATSTFATKVLRRVAASPDGILLAVGDPNTDYWIQILMSKDGGNVWTDKTQEFGRRYYDVDHTLARGWMIAGTDWAGSGAVILAGLRSGTD